jgi:hypothetical protein
MVKSKALSKDLQKVSKVEFEDMYKFVMLEAAMAELS